ncbi:hypothetical protein [Caldithrix abyssi]
MRSPFRAGRRLAVAAVNLRAVKEIGNGQKKLQKCEKWSILNRMLHRAEKERRSYNMLQAKADGSSGIFEFLVAQEMVKVSV